MNCSVTTCGTTGEPAPVPPMMRTKAIPDGWLQVMVTDHLDRTRNFVLCPIHSGASVKDLVAM